MGPTVTRHASARRSGAVLLEVLIGLAILGAVGGSVLGLIADASAATRRVHRSDAQLREASALLEAVTLWTTGDLDRHLGWRAQGDWRMWVGREPGSVYTIRLARADSGGELLRTSLYRPEAAPEVAPEVAP